MKVPPDERERVVAEESRQLHSDGIKPATLKWIFSGGDSSRPEEGSAVIYGAWEACDTEKFVLPRIPGVDLCDPMRVCSAQFFNVRLEFEKTRDLRFPRQIYFHARQTAAP